MEPISKIPAEKFKQDPTDGLYKFGSIEMTSSEFALALELESVQRHIIDIERRLALQESR
jgi:hypothetical protein